MKWELYGYQYKNLCRLVQAVIIRQICSLRGHPRAKFYAATGVEPIGDTFNAKIGVTFVCPDCHKSWAGDIKAGFLHRKGAVTAQLAFRPKSQKGGMN